LSSSHAARTRARLLLPSPKPLNPKPVLDCCFPPSFGCSAYSLGCFPYSRLFSPYSRLCLRLLSPSLHSLFLLSRLFLRLLSPSLHSLFLLSRLFLRLLSPSLHSLFLLVPSRPLPDRDAHGIDNVPADGGHLYIMRGEGCTAVRRGEMHGTGASDVTCSLAPALARFHKQAQTYARRHKASACARQPASAGSPSAAAIAARSSALSTRYSVFRRCRRGLNTRSRGSLQTSKHGRHDLPERYCSYLMPST
jgi:hypothetical protein